MENTKSEEVELRGPGGLTAKFSGPQAACVGVLLAIGALVVYLIYQHEAHSAESMTTVVRAQEAVKEELRQNREAQEAMIYVISLPQTERERLNLARPKKLTDMQR